MSCECNTATKYTVTTASIIAAVVAVVILANTPGKLLHCGCKTGAENSASTRDQLGDVLLCVCVVKI